MLPIILILAITITYTNDFASTKGKLGNIMMRTAIMIYGCDIPGSLGCGVSGVMVTFIQI
jgi:hypothetical protein